MKLYFYKYNTVIFKWIPKITCVSLQWKDKYDTPRILSVPRLEIDWLNFSAGVEFGGEDYWEKRVWVKYYNDGDKERAEKNWPWPKTEE